MAQSRCNGADVKRWLLVLLTLSCTDPRHGRVGTIAELPEVSDPAPTLHVCGQQNAEVAGVVDVSVLLVMDRSRSMSQGSKWEQTRAAVEAALGAYDRYLRFGLLMYPTGADVCDEVERAFDVPIALGNGDAISAAMADAEILRGTPTGAALRTAGDLLDSDPGQHRVVILATDGGPDCTAEGWDDGGLADVEAYDATSDLAEAGIPVYVVGIQGSGSARNVLNRIADIGGTAKPGDTAFYETTSGAEFAQALIDIALDVDGCTFTLDEHEDAVRMDVALDGAALGNDGNAGWELHDGRLRLNGVACLATPGTAHQVGVTWYCE